MSGAQWPVVMVTGHRSLPAEQYRWMDAELNRVLGRLVTEYGMTTGVSGMALCVDQRWAELVKLAGLRLHAVLPFATQAAPWKPEQQDHWQNILDAADEITCVSKQDPDSPRAAARMLHQRNDAMLRISQAVVAVADWAKLKRNDRGQIVGGTWSAVEKAARRHKPIIWLDPRAETVKLPSLGAWVENLRVRL